MPWYVFALVDQPPAARPRRGLTGAVGLRRIGRAVAVVERREDVPPAEFGVLQRHHDLVQQLARQVPAILPVRFGTLLDTGALEEVLQDRDDEIDEAFAVVRNRVQFTWRAQRSSKTSKTSPTPASAVTGAEYLRRAARASRPAPPAAWGGVRLKLAPLIAAERYQPASAQLPDSLYHLVDRDAESRYATVGRALVHASPRLQMTGPWPPFAFAPELL